MKPQFDFNKLFHLVSKQMGEELSTQELEDLLLINEDAFQKDSPISVGKSLIILSIEFNGNKTLKENKYPIHYYREFSKGVSLWVGDNLVGKSSIFKIIKLALTGRNSIAKDVESWLTEIWLEFQVGSNNYTTLIAREKNDNLKFSLVSCDRKAIAANPNSQNTITLYEAGIGKFEEFMQSFFFRELGYYALQWTQNSSHRDNPKLLTSNTSWATYYKSVYLEADDYNVLFWGQQAELIIQMLLGLELTYPINRLKVKKEHLLYKLGITQITEDPSNQLDKTLQETIQNELSQINNDLNDLKNKAQNATVTKPQSTEKKLEDARQEYRNAIESRRKLENVLYTLNDNLNTYQRKLSNLGRQLDDYRIDIVKKDRAVNDLNDYIQLGAFFNSLEVKRCPNCNHSVEREKIVHEKSTGSCRLCDHGLEQQNIETESYEYQIQQLQEQRQHLNNDMIQLQAEYLNAKNSFDGCKTQIDTIEKKINEIPFNRLQQQISKFQQEITDKPKPYDWVSHMNKVSELTTRKTMLEQSLTNTKPVIITDIKKSLIEKQIKAIELAEEELKRQRTERSREPMEKFEQLYLKQLHSFGLPHYDKVEIKPNFKISYYMHDREFAFDEISAGEKLRAKLGLYISLIEMDVEYQLGHHPRFIVLDSPAKEEGDRTYVEGLKTTLAYIEEQFGKELQIFIGTAQRDLVNTVDSTKVEEREEKQFFF